MPSRQSAYTAAIVSGPCDQLHDARVRFEWDVLASSSHPLPNGDCNIHALVPEWQVHELRESGLDVLIVQAGEDDD